MTTTGSPSGHAARRFGSISSRLIAPAWRLLLSIAIVIGLPGTQPVAQAATFPGGFAETFVAGGLSSPTAFAIAPDGRLFVCLQGGQLRVIKNGTLLAAPFITVPVDSSGERGLLGVTFDPSFATNQYVYVYYTATSPTPHNRISRFTASGDVAVAGSEVVLLELDPLSSAVFHNGGAMHFGSDGKLYIATGENKNSANAQSMSTLLGKMLRINSDGTIPTDNPFYASATGANRAIWALGLRNPYTFAFQPGSTRMFINDVGENVWEEINDGIKAANYGWPTCEGSCSPPNPSFRDPLYQYAHDGTSCAITGGAFYNPAVSQFPSDYTGDYFFADYCAGWIKRYDLATSAVSTFATGIASPVDLHVAPDGSLYYLARGNSAVYRVQYTASQLPSISQHPASQTVAAGQSVTFEVSASGTPPLRYQWQRNGVDVTGATSASYTIQAVSQADNGAQFRAVVSNAAGSVTSNAATLTVTANQPPTATITTPAAGTVYSAGQTINYAGTATDPEQGTLPASAFTWRVDFHHDDHLHPFIPPTTGVTSGSFVIPTTGETSPNVWYRIHLDVQDAGGLTSSTYRDIMPRKVDLTFHSNPSGLELTLDGQPATTPFKITSVVGMKRQLGATSPQTRNGTTYAFDSWSDNGAQQHEITVGGSNTTYTASFTTTSASPSATPTPPESASPTPTATGSATPPASPTAPGSPQPSPSVPMTPAPTAPITPSPVSSPQPSSSTYLSDLVPVVSYGAWGPVERDQSTGDQAAGDGHTLTLNGTTYAKGLGVHAYSDVRFTVTGCTRFRAAVGIDDEVGSSGTVIFRVYTDWNSRFDSGVMTGSSPTQMIDIPLAGVDTLQLIAHEAGDGIASDHADWADARVDCGSQSGNVVYLGDTSWTSATSGWGPVERNMSNGDLAAGDGRTLMLNGTTYAKGLGVHPYSDVRYAATGCTRFQAAVGVDDEAGSNGSVVFSVLTDGVQRFTSGVMTGASPTQQVDTPLTGVTTLQLVVTDGGDGTYYDHADWADARLECKAG